MKSKDASDRSSGRDPRDGPCVSYDSHGRRRPSTPGGSEGYIEKREYKKDGLGRGYTVYVDYKMDDCECNRRNQRSKDDYWNGGCESYTGKPWIDSEDDKEDDKEDG